MPHCVSAPSSPISFAQNRARVHMVPAAQDNLSWLIEYQPNVVALIDGPSLSPVVDYLQQHQLKLTHILNTHIHGDHIGVNHGLSRAQEKYPHLFASEVEVWGSALTAEHIPHLTRSLTGGDLLELGTLKGMCWLTEGHLNGHISFIFWDQASKNSSPREGDEAALFCGDTLFAAGCGRLFDGPPEKMYQSLQRLCGLPRDTLAFPAHEYTLDNLRFARFACPDQQEIQTRLSSCTRIREEGRSTLPTTIEEERLTNPFYLATDVEHFARLRSEKDQGLHRQ